MQDNKCIVIDSAMTKTIVVFRSLTDLIYFFYMLLQVIAPSPFAEAAFVFIYFNSNQVVCLINLLIWTIC
jgi:hypothetical protein